MNSPHLVSLSLWENRFSGLSLAQNGDDIEKHACQSGLLQRIPNYEVFWKLHVAPATQRENNNIALRSATKHSLASLAIISHSLLVELLWAGDALDLVVKKGDFGQWYKNAFDVITYTGNAIQKSSELGFWIDGGDGFPNPLSQELRNIAQARSTYEVLPIAARNISVSGQPAFNDWLDDRKGDIKYRNSLTHYGRLAIFQDTNASQVSVLKQSALKKNMTWAAQEREAQNLSNLESFHQACQNTYDRSLVLINQMYGFVVAALAPARTTKAYQTLWGWNTSQGGDAAWQRPNGSGSNLSIGAQGAQGAVPSPNGIAPPPNINVSGRALLPRNTP